MENRDAATSAHIRSREFATKSLRKSVDELLLQFKSRNGRFLKKTDCTVLNFAKTGSDRIVGLRFHTSFSLSVVYRPYFILFRLEEILMLPGHLLNAQEVVSTKK